MFCSDHTKYFNKIILFTSSNLYFKGVKQQKKKLHIIFEEREIHGSHKPMYLLKYCLQNGIRSYKLLISNRVFGNVNSIKVHHV